MKVYYSFSEIAALAIAIKEISREVSFKTSKGLEYSDSNEAKGIAAMDLQTIIAKFCAGGYTVTETGVEIEFPEAEFIAVCRVLENRSSMIGKLISMSITLLYLTNEVIDGVMGDIKDVIKSLKK